MVYRKCSALNPPPSHLPAKNRCVTTTCNNRVEDGRALRAQHKKREVQTTRRRFRPLEPQSHAQCVDAQPRRAIVA